MYLGIYHIRKRLRRRGGTQFYLDRGERRAETICGAAVTDHDVPWNAVAVEWSNAYGHYEPCAACLHRQEQGRSETR